MLLVASLCVRMTGCHASACKSATRIDGCVPYGGLLVTLRRRYCQAPVCAAIWRGAALGLSLRALHMSHRRARREATYTYDTVLYTCTSRVLARTRDIPAYASWERCHFFMIRLRPMQILRAPN